MTARWTLVRAGFVVLGLIAAVPAQAATYYVSKSGSDSNSCATATSTTQSNQKLTFTAGMTCLVAGGPGSSLVVHAGTYAEGGGLTISAVGTNWTCGSGAYCVSAAPGETVWFAPYSTTSSVTFSDAAYWIFDHIGLDGMNHVDNSSPSNAALATNVYFTTDQAHLGHHIRWQYSTTKNSMWSGWDGELWDYLELIDVVSKDGGRCYTGSGGYPSCSPHPSHGFYFNCQAASGHDSHAVFDGLESTGWTIGPLDSGMQLYWGAPTQRGGGLTVKRSRFHHNNQGMYIYNCGTPAPRFENVILDHNSAGIGAGDLTAGFEFVHGVIANNGGWAIDAGVYTAVVGIVLTDSVVKDNASGPVRIWNTYATSRITATYNDFHGNGNGNANDDQPGISTFASNITTDPAFVNPAAGNYSILDTSPLFNAGTPAGVTTDFGGLSRPQGAAYDIGAFEVDTIESPPVGPSRVRRKPS